MASNLINLKFQFHVSVSCFSFKFKFQVSIKIRFMFKFLFKLKFLGFVEAPVGVFNLLFIAKTSLKDCMMEKKIKCNSYYILVNYRRILKWRKDFQQCNRYMTVHYNSIQYIYINFTKYSVIYRKNNFEELYVRGLKI